MCAPRERTPICWQRKPRRSRRRQPLPVVYLPGALAVGAKGRSVQLLAWHGNLWQCPIACGHGASCKLSPFWWAAALSGWAGPLGCPLGAITYYCCLFCCLCCLCGRPAPQPPGLPGPAGKAVAPPGWQGCGPRPAGKAVAPARQRRPSEHRE